ncbi:MAG: ATP-binding cassette domain-containing protein [Erysipelotrichaceae bacterium]|nr:ATP-binding cassette domain-containing protein [Erysipelotrichaceae bacterium]
MNDIILKTTNLTKKYKDFIALNNVSVQINKGDIYGLIGRNGAGKTTLMKVITTLSDRTSGEIELFENSDKDLTQTKRRIGCLIENPAFFPNLSAYDNLKYYAIQKGIVDDTQITDALSLVELTDIKKRKFKNFSLGMKQRLGIAFALLDNPDFIILDEPINGLDPIGISHLRETFKKLNEEKGITILISSHILSELYLLANKFCFIEKGKVIKELSKEELGLECSKCIFIKTPDITKVCTILEQDLQTTKYIVINKEEIRLYDYLDNSSIVNKTLVTHNIEVKELKETGISLEDYFKNLVEESLYD